MRFHDALRTLKAQDCTVVVEIGPHPTLTAMARPEEGGSSWLASLRRKRGDLATLRETLAGLYVAGAPIDWAAVHRHQPHNPIRLPNLSLPAQTLLDGPNACGESGRRGDRRPAAAGPPLPGRPAVVAAGPRAVRDPVQSEPLCRWSATTRIFGMPWVKFATYPERPSPAPARPMARPRRR